SAGPLLEHPLPRSGSRDQEQPPWVRKNGYAFAAIYKERVLVLQARADARARSDRHRLTGPGDGAAEGFANDCGRLSTDPRLSRPGGPGAAARLRARDRRGGTALPAGDAAYRAAVLGPHDQCRPAALVLRPPRLPLPATPPRHRPSVAAD